MAPVVASCGEDASVPMRHCQTAREYCRSIGETAPACRPLDRVEQAHAQGFMPDLGLPHLVDGGCGSGNCPVCHGDCDDDDECAPGLVCYQRDTKHNVPPGCEYEIPPSDIEQTLWGSTGSIDEDSDFCIDPNARHPDWVPVNSSFWVYVEGDTNGGSRLESTGQLIDEIWEYEDPHSACQRVWQSVLNRCGSTTLAWLGVRSALWPDRSVHLSVVSTVALVL